MLSFSSDISAPAPATRQIILHDLLGHSRRLSPVYVYGTYGEADPLQAAPSFLLDNLQHDDIGFRLRRADYISCQHSNQIPHSSQQICHPYSGP